MSRSESEPVEIIWMAIIFEGTLLLLALALGWAFGHPPLLRIHLNWQAVVLGILATFPLVALLPCVNVQWGPFPSLMREVEETVFPLFINCSAVHFLLISVLAGFGEEALFRGVLLSTLTDIFGSWTALVLVSVLFGLVHLVTPTYAFLAGAVGLYLGWLSIINDNLLLPIVVHAVYDFVALMYLTRRFKHKSGRSPKSETDL